MPKSFAPGIKFREMHEREVVKGDDPLHAPMQSQEIEMRAKNDSWLEKWIDFRPIQPAERKIQEPVGHPPVDDTNVFFTRPTRRQNRFLEAVVKKYVLVFTVRLEEMIDQQFGIALDAGKFSFR